MSSRIRDHVGLWRDSLVHWVPGTVFDAHVHLCPPEVMGPFSDARRRDPLTSFDSLTHEEYIAAMEQLFGGVTLAGMFAFPLPLREVDRDAANDYIISLMRLDRRVHGFALADPQDPEPTIAALERAERAGVRFTGVKPYYDFTGKSNFDCTMPEFIPDALLQQLHSERLVLMLHTAGTGVGEAQNRRYLRRIAERFPDMPVVLAHMGRYTEPTQFFTFLESGLLDECPSLMLDMSSVSVSEVYRRFLEDRRLWHRLLFATDLPYGLITGVERWSDTHGAVFVSRDDYLWSDPAMQERFSEERQKLTHNTYHCLDALREAFADLAFEDRVAERLKRAIFADNALSLCSRVKA